ncbi:MAG TPA: sulfotransferase [Aestuariivirgaceae bacterium]|jgi:tetratricopeptide (TPR) repeat protein
MKARPLPFADQERQPFHPQLPVSLGAQPPKKSAQLFSPKILQILQRGLDLQRQGKLQEAEYHYQLVLRQHPDHPEALNLLGTLASKAKNHTVAIECLTKAVSAQPKNFYYRNNLGYCLNNAKKAREAIPHFRKAMADNPRMVEPVVGLGNSYRLLGEGENAEKIFRRAIEMDPSSIRFKSLLGEALIDLGKIKEAAEIFRSILAKDSHNISAIVGLAGAREAGDQEGDLERFEFALKDASLEPEKRVSLHMALGQIYDQQKKPTVAFPHFIQANELDKEPFSLQDYRKQIDLLIETFTPFFILSKSGFGNPTDRPIFVVGMPRSGTTLTEQILSSHPQVTGAGELKDMPHINASLGAGPKWRRQIARLSQDKCRELAGSYLAELDRHSRTSARVVDKMPHNFMQVGLITLLFPNARIIHCRRDAMDNCVSIYTHRFNKAHGYSTDMKILGLYYREYRRLMEHWRKALPGKMFELQYEDMIADQESMSRKLIDFVGLEWDEACLSFHETERTVRTLSRWQVRQPIYTSSVKRWKKYDEFLGPLKEGLGDLVDAD